MDSNWYTTLLARHRRGLSSPACEKRDGEEKRSVNRPRPVIAETLSTAAEKPGIDYQKKKRRPHDGHGARLEDLVNIACSARRRCRADRGCLVPGERTGPPRTIAVIPEIQKPACLLSILVPISIRSVSRTSPA